MDEILVTSLTRRPRSRSGSGRERSHLVSSVCCRVRDKPDQKKHTLIPLNSERRIQHLTPYPPTSDTGRPTHGGVFQPCFSAQPSADSGFGSMGDITEALDSSASSLDDDSSVTFAHAHYSESISVAVVPKEPIPSYISFYDVKTKPRCKSAVEFNACLSPVGYQNKMIVYRNSTRKKFKNVVHYEPKNRPVHFAETFYMRPRKPEKTFISCIDIGGKPERKWYESTLHLIPVTHSCTQVANVEMALNSDGEEIEYDDSVFTEHVRMRMDALGENFYDSLRCSTRSSFSKPSTSEPHSYSTSVFVHGQREKQPYQNGPTNGIYQNGHLSNESDA